MLQSLYDLDSFYSKIKIDKIHIQSILDENEYNLICKLLSFKGVKSSINRISLHLSTLSELLNILDLWCKLVQIEILQLFYKYADLPEDRLFQKMTEFNNVQGLIYSLNIKQL